MQQVYEKIKYLVKVDARVNRYPGRRLSDWSQEQLLKLLAGEVVELAECIYCREYTTKEQLLAELADNFNYLLQIAIRENVTFPEIIEAMTKKLDERLSIPTREPYKS